MILQNHPTSSGTSSFRSTKRRKRKKSREVCRRNSQIHMHRATKSGDVSPLPTTTYSMEMVYGSVMLNLATGWIHCNPMQKESSQETARNLRTFFDQKKFPMVYGKACEDLQWKHRTSTSNRTGTNELAERAARTPRRHFICFVAKSGGHNVLRCTQCRRYLNQMGHST